MYREIHVRFAFSLSSCRSGVSRRSSWHLNARINVIIFCLQSKFKEQIESDASEWFGMKWAVQVDDVYYQWILTFNLKLSSMTSCRSGHAQQKTKYNFEFIVHFDACLCCTDDNSKCFAKVSSIIPGMVDWFIATSRNRCEQLIDSWLLSACLQNIFHFVFFLSFVEKSRCANVAYVVRTHFGCAKLNIVRIYTLQYTDT